MELHLNTITLTWAQVLVIVLAAIGLYVIELISFMRAARRQAQQEQFARERLDAMAAELTALRERVDALGIALEDIRRGPKTSGQYREAVEMAERGLDAEALADNCGISRAEADLIVALYRSRAA
jgi:Flp pilus assembly protein TadB